MFRPRALGRANPTGFLILIAALVSLAACGGPKFPNIPSSADDSRIPVSSSGSDSALRLARATRQAGDLPTAIQLYRTLIATTSPSGEVVVEFGDVLLQAGFPDDAIDIYSGVNARSSARLGALLGLTRAYLNLGEAAKALEYVNDAEKMRPDDIRVLVDRGVALDSLDRHGEAQQCYRAVLVISPRHVSARNNLALSLALTGQYDEAIALMAPLVRSSAATPQVRENMAIIYGLMGDTDHATTLSRMDLDAGTTRSNLQFLASVRGAGS